MFLQFAIAHLPSVDVRQVPSSRAHLAFINTEKFFEIQMSVDWGVYPSIIQQGMVQADSIDPWLSSQFISHHSSGLAQ
jgi:hypothetical protein